MNDGQQDAKKGALADFIIAKLGSMPGDEGLMVTVVVTDIPRDDERIGAVEIACSDKTISRATLTMLFAKIARQLVTECDCPKCQGRRSAGAH